MLDQSRQTKQRDGSERGAALVEFGFVLLPTMGFIFLLLTLAWAVFAWACVQEGVREGARVAVTCTPTTSLNAAISSIVQQYSFGFVKPTNVSITYLDPTTLTAITTPQVYTGDVVNVKVSNVRVTGFANIMGSSGPLTVSASAADIMSCPSPATP